jgi:ubiquitin related modifier 1
MSLHQINVTFSGGCEILFGTRNLQIQVPAESNLGALVVLLKDRIVERPDQFIVGNNTLRPGILALVNDTDGDLLGGSEYVLEDKDEISFISTLHGG